MRQPLVSLAVAALVAASVFASLHLLSAPAASSARAARSPFLPQPPTGAPRELVLFGRVESLNRKGGHFELRFDPAEYLSGETANRAAIEDKVIPPGDVVPNDHYVRDEGHPLLTYIVPRTAHVTVRRRQGSSCARDQRVRARADREG